MTKKFSAELHFAKTDQELEADLRKFSHIESDQSAKTVIFKEIRKGPTPIRKKMIDAFRTAEKFESNRICFLLEIDSVEHKAILGLLDIKGIKYHGI